ncbi:hypothetical protein IE077_000858 [Cardiosporidium cionae]|uniref:Uncharacterized protein n=1 Tax=Cardiosporidium cionae TaxID=476202 RepID=A0ABQ7JE73_9APIC|nr:hypothetical protein IE077_000858 [Cardiosporidium cionae]|eukprot:KAF8822179.1 hypothetical protein IE077_000858 [Cardiosporidium cionae]
MEEYFQYGVEKVYSNVIDATIEKCSSIQNTRVLDALKTRWKSALNERLLRCGRVKERGSNGFLSARNLETDRLSATIATTDPLFCNNISEPEICISEPRTHSEATSLPEALSAAKNSSEDEEDEFVDADVDVSAGHVELPIAKIPAERSFSQENHQKCIELDDILSDLDDEEPVARDFIVALFEKVARPSGKRTTSSTRWKVVLSNGILQLDGQEILFDKMVGDFSFE